jgi:hypothetical protein
MNVIMTRIAPMWQSEDKLFHYSDKERAESNASSPADVKEVFVVIPTDYFIGTWQPIEQFKDGVFDTEDEAKEYMKNLDNVTMYDNPLDGISIAFGDKVKVIGEQTVEHEGRTLEQYLYHIVGYTAENGKPFVSLKANIRLV